MLARADEATLKLGHMKLVGSWVKEQREDNNARTEE